MPDLVEVGEQLVETALTFAPWLEEVPVLGRILSAIVPTGGSDIKALEAYESELVKKKTETEARIKKNARYVLKASDAMQCVNDHLLKSSILLSMGKALVNRVAHRPGGSFPQAVADRIFTCIESKVLTQSNQRVRREKVYYGRPARGHGKGRITRKVGRAKQALPQP